MSTTHSYQVCEGRTLRFRPTHHLFRGSATAGGATWRAMVARTVGAFATSTHRVTVGVYGGLCSLVGDVTTSNPVEGDVLMRSWYR